MCKTSGFIMTKIKDLELELKTLQEKRKRDMKIKQLKKQIEGEKFAQTKKGKIFNAVGDFGLKVAKKISTPTPEQKGKTKLKVMSVEDAMRRMPQ